MAIHKRKSDGAEKGIAPAAAIPAGWQTAATASFRIVFQQASPMTAAVAKAVEQTRSAAFEKWSGPPAEWAPRCDIWLHANGDEYAKATKQSSTSPGHSSVSIKDGRVQQRRSTCA